MDILTKRPRNSNAVLKSFHALIVENRNASSGATVHQLRNSYNKYENNSRLCDRQNIANVTCSLFSKHRRRDEFREIFQQWTTFAERHRIPYVLACGSLLGQYRRQDIIPWDDDVDVYVDVQYYDNLRRHAQSRNFHQESDELFRFVVQPEFNVKRRREPRRWSCDGQQVNKMLDLCSFSGPMARLIRRRDYVDVFAIETRNGLVYDDEDKVTYAYSDFYPFVDCNFMDIPTKCPQNSKAVLEEYFKHELEPYCNCVNDKWVVNWWW